MGLNDIHSLSHTKWNCKYHNIVFAPILSITQEHISTHQVKSLSTCDLNTKAVPFAKLLENIFAIIGFFGVSPQKNLQRGLAFGPFGAGAGGTDAGAFGDPYPAKKAGAPHPGREIKTELFSKKAQAGNRSALFYALGTEGGTVLASTEL